MGGSGVSVEVWKERRDRDRLGRRLQRRSRAHRFPSHPNRRPVSGDQAVAYTD